MTVNATPANAPERVWVCPPAGVNLDGSAFAPPAATPSATAPAFVFPFSPAAAWVLYPGLIPSSSASTPSALGAASFDLLRQSRQGPSDNQPISYPALIEGSFVAIDCGVGQLAFSGGNLLWLGWVTKTDAVQIAGTLDCVGVSAARELGDLLDRQQVVGWGKFQSGQGEFTVMQSPPTANIGDPSGQIIGNCFQESSGGTTTNVWAFASNPTDFGYAFPLNDGSGNYSGDTAKYWTRWRLLLHLINNCMPPSMPPFTVACADGYVTNDPTTAGMIATYLNNTKQPEIFDLRDLTILGALDLLIPRERSLGWKLVPIDGQTGPQLQILIYTLASTSAYGVPANTTTAIIPAATDPIDSVRVIRDASDLPDKVIIEGSPCTFTGTIAVSDGNAAIGWNQGAPQTAYLAGASGMTGYSDLTPQLQIEQNQLVRAQGWLRDVFARFVVAPTSTGDVRIASLPASTSITVADGPPPPAPALANPLCPNLKWNTLTKKLAIDGSLSRTPYLGSSAVLRTLCVPYGIKSDGTDQRTQQQKVQPQYIPLRVFAYDASKVEGTQWRDLTRSSPFWNLAVASVGPDERGAAIRVEFSPREILAAGIWPTDGSAALADIDPSVNPTAINYQTLAFTICMESDQRVYVEYRRPGVAKLQAGADAGSDVSVRRTLKIRIPRLRCDGIWTGTVLSVAPPGGTVDTPDRWTGTSLSIGSDGISFLRNDWGIADYYGQMAAAFAFRPRVSIEASRAVVTAFPAYASIGTLITAVQEDVVGAVLLTVNTVVESVTRIYGDAPRIIIQTTMPPPPTFGTGGGGGVSASPSSGGVQSAAAGGTPTQVTQALREDVQDLQQRSQRTPLITMVPYTEQPGLQVQIIGGQIESTEVPVIQYAADPLTVPSAYNPNVDTAYVPGIGNGVLMNAAGQPLGKVLVRHNWNGFTDSKAVGDVFQVGSPISVAVSGGGSVLAYPIIGMQ